MTTIHAPAATTRRRMSSLRKTSLVAGVIYLITFVSIPTLSLYTAVRTDPNYVAGPGPDTAAQLGGALEMIVALACIGTAVALYPVVKRQNQGLALAFVGARTLEAAAIVTGVVSLLSIVTLRREGLGESAVPTAHALVAMYDWTFLLGQTLMPAINALLLGSLLYRSRLVPRVLPLIGLIGAPLLLATTALTFLGITDRLSVWSAIGAAPIAVWEFSLGIWLVVKGFRRSPITEQVAPAVASRDFSGVSA
jgi:Domain of unknown function (DUF4386)